MSKIEWTNITWNPVTGCTKISPGCKNCYAERMARRLAGRFGYPCQPNHFQIALHPDGFDSVLRRQLPCKVFVCSMGDLFHKDVSFAYIDKVFAVTVLKPQLVFQFLTKRVDRMKEYILYAKAKRGQKTKWPFPNVWLGTSVENESYVHRIDVLRQIDATVRFLSLEPLLGPLPNLNLDGIHWVITGAESGPRARQANPEWFREILYQCKALGIPFFMKQMTDSIPDDLLVREFPK